jgi:Na+/proline symporter
VARNSAIAAGAMCIAVGSLAVLIGLGAGALGAEADPERLVHSTARALLSPWMYVIFAGGFLAAVLSTVDSTLLVAAGLCSHNLVVPAMKVSSEPAKLRLTRYCVAGFGVVAWLIARSAEDISSIVELSSSLGSAGVVVTITFGLFTTFGGPAAAAAALLAGMTVFVGATVAGAGTPFLLSLGASVAAYCGAAGLARVRARWTDQPLARAHRPQDP